MKHNFLHRQLPRLLLLLVVIFAGVYWFWLTERTPIIADTLGYVYAGEQLATGHGLVLEDVHNQTAGPYFSMFAFQIRRTEDGRMFFGFPPGFPFLLAAAPWITGNLDAVHLVVPLFALVGVVITYLLGRHISGHEWVGFLAAAMVAFSPTYWEISTGAWSEIPTMVVGTLGTLIYLLSRQSKRSLSQQIWLSVLGAALLNYSLYIRYANITLFPAFALFELVTARTKLLSQKWRYLFFLILGLGVLSTLVFNNWYYGGPFLTNYSPEHGWYPTPAFSLSYAINESMADGGSLLAAVKTLWANFPFILLLMPLGWLWMKRPFMWLTAVMIIITFALYSVYAFVASGINSRFFIPIYPFIAVAIASALCELGKRVSRPQVNVIGVVALMLLLSWSVPAQIHALQDRNEKNINTASRAEELVAFSQPDAVFMSYVFNDSIIYYGKRSVLNYRRIPPSDADLGQYRVDQLEPCLVQTVNRLLAQNKPVYFIEDSNPTYWNTLELIRKDYELEVVQKGPTIYQLKSPPSLEQIEGQCKQ